MPMISPRILLLAIAVVASGCHKSKVEAEKAPEPELHPLSGMAAQALIVAPVQSVRIAPELGWLAFARPAAVTAALDSVIAATMKSRVGNQQWVYADGLARAFANNPTYAPDARSLAVAPLRSTALKIDQRLPEPLASQLRTMIAFHDARLVLLPVELRFDRTPAGQGRPVVRLVLVDPRTSVVRWIGEVMGADLPVFTPTYSALIADRLADLFVAK